MPIRWDNIAGPNFAPGHLMNVAQGSFEAGARGAYTGALQLQDTLTAAKDQITNSAAMQFLKSGAKTSAELMSSLRGMNLNPNVDMGDLSQTLSSYGGALDTADAQGRQATSRDNIALLDKAYLDMQAQMDPNAFNEQTAQTPILKLASSLEASDPNKYRGITQDYAKSLEGQRMAKAEDLQASLVAAEEEKSQAIAETVKANHKALLETNQFTGYFNTETNSIGWDKNDKERGPRLSGNQSVFDAISNSLMGDRKFNPKDELNEDEQEELAAIGRKYGDPNLVRLLVASAVKTTDGKFDSFDLKALKKLESVLWDDIGRSVSGDPNRKSYLNRIFTDLSEGMNAEEVYEDVTKYKNQADGVAQAESGAGAAGETPQQLSNRLRQELTTGTVAQERPWVTSVKTNAKAVGVAPQIPLPGPLGALANALIQPERDPNRIRPVPTNPAAELIKSIFVKKRGMSEEERAEKAEQLRQLDATLNAERN